MEANNRPGPWLTAEQQQIWRSYLAMQRLLDESIQRDMQLTGHMPHAYYLILAMLSEAPEHRLRMNRLAEVTGSSQSRLSHAVTRLEALGWVTREQDSTDRRGQVAALTPAGYERLVRTAPLHAETVRSVLFDPLTPEQQAALGDICRTILSAGDGEKQVRQMDPTA